MNMQNISKDNTNREDMNSLLRGKKLETESFSGSNVPHSEALTIVTKVPISQLLEVNYLQ